MVDLLMEMARSLEVIEEVTRERAREALEAGRFDEAAARVEVMAKLSQRAREFAEDVRRVHTALILDGDAPEVVDGQRDEMRAAVLLEADVPGPWETVA